MYSDPTTQGGGSPNDQVQPDNRPLFEVKTYKYPQAAPYMINWNWHDEIEWCRVHSGSLICAVSGQRTQLTEGQCVMINTGIMHAYGPAPGRPEVEFSIVKYDSSLLADSGTVIYEKYIRAQMDRRSLPCVILTGGEPWQDESLRMIGNICAMNREAFAWEVEMRARLCELWILVSREFPVIQYSPKSAGNQRINETRAKLMLSFIQKNYQSDLTIDAIAASASISRSECFRCFKRALDIKPVEYLTAYRIERAIELLLNTRRSVTDICLSCGF